MNKLDPKAVWLFFISSFFGCCLPVAFLAFWFGMTAPFIKLFSVFFSDPAVVTSTVNYTYSGSYNYAGSGIWFLVAFLVYSALCFAWAKLTVHFYRYELTDAGFRKEYGIITKKYVTIPYDRIQNVDIYRTLIARMFGLSTLNIQTAGSSAVVAGRSMVGVGAEGQLPGLSREVAEQLRDELINRAGRSKNQGV